MQDYFSRITSEARSLTSPAEARLAVVSTLRLYLHQIVYGLLEWLSRQSPDPERQPPLEVLNKLRAPTDGALVEAVEALAVACESMGWSGAARLGYLQIKEANLVRFVGGHSSTPLGIMRAIVELRNDGAEGHGLLGGFNPVIEIDALAYVIEHFVPLLPAESNGKLLIGPEHLSLEISFLRLWGGLPALVRKIRPSTPGSVRIDAQCAPRLGERQKFTYEEKDPFAGFTGSTLPALEVWNNSWKPLVQVPLRMTDTFAGRQREIELLTEWFDDEGLRTALVYGDGGFGKTTLVVEYINKILSEELDVDWKPQVVTFYTAKRWRWGLDGLEPISAGQPHLMDLLAHLHKVLLGCYPDARFFSAGVTGATTYLQREMEKELGLTRSQHLIIIDNAETLIDNEEDRESLGRQIRDVGRRLGRIIVTSRRRELLEASPIEVKSLPEADAVKLLRHRGGDKLNINAINKAKNEQLFVTVRELECRPLVLEAFLRALQSPATHTIAKAKKLVSSMLSDDLGDFLFADAWGRLKPEMRALLLLMAKVADVHDSELLRLCAGHVGITSQRAEEVFSESGGIASVIQKSDGLEIAFSKNFIRYAETKTVKFKGGEDFPSSQDVSVIRGKYSRFIRAAANFRGDRIARAFRTPAARAAHNEALAGRLEEADRLYQQAVASDASNGWLFDRYAYFLCQMKRELGAALDRANTAVALLPDEGEVWYTKGLIEARSRLRHAASSIDKAQELGVAPMRCAIQRCWAYLSQIPAQLGLAEAELRDIDNGSYGKIDNRASTQIAHIRSRVTFLRERTITGNTLRRRTGEPAR